MVRDTILGSFVKSPWYSTFITVKYDILLKIVFCEIKVCGKVRTVTPIGATSFNNVSS